MDKVAKTLATKSARSICRDHLFKSPKFNCWTLELVRWLWSSDCSDTWPTFNPCKKLPFLLKSHDWREWRWPYGRVCKFQSCKQLIQSYLHIHKYMHAFVCVRQILKKVSFFVCPFFGFLTLHCFYFVSIHFFLPRLEKTRGKSAHFLIFTVGFYLSRFAWYTALKNWRPKNGNSCIL